MSRNVKKPVKKAGKKTESKIVGKKLAPSAWKHRYKKFTLPTFRSPLEDQGEIVFRDEIDHAFFLRCCELYRVLDLMERTTEHLTEVYSKYRHRTQFTETLTFRYFDSEEALVAQFDPQLAAKLFFLFNLLYELRIILTYTDDLPLTVKKDIDDTMLTLKDAWNELTIGVQEKYGWQFKKIAMPDPWVA